MTRRTKALAALALCLALGLTVWLVERDSAPRVFETNDLDFADSRRAGIASDDTDKLQALATSSCKCERAGGSEGSCWADYKTAIAPLQVAGMGTACAPVSSELDCITSEAGETCIVTGYYVNAAAESDRDVMVCTDTEARAVEKASADAFQIDGKPVDSSNEAAWEQANQRAQENIARVLDRIRNGEAFAAEATPGSCV